MNSLLVIFRTAPHSSAEGQEGLDAVLAALAMDMKVSVLMLDDAVFILKSGQSAGESGARVFSKGFAALYDLGLHALWVDESSLSARGVQLNQLVVEAQVLSGDRVSELIRQHQRVITF